MISLLYLTLLTTTSSGEDQSPENVDLEKHDSFSKFEDANSDDGEAKSRPKRFFVLSYLLGYKLGAKTVAKYSNYQPYPVVAYYPVVVSKNYYG